VRFGGGSTMQNKAVLDMKWIFYINNAVEDNFKDQVGYIHSWNITKDNIEDIKAEGALAKVKAYHFDMTKGEGHISDSYPFVIYSLYYDENLNNYCAKVRGLGDKEYAFELPIQALNMMAEIRELAKELEG